jgi:hypothetical protein
MLQQRIVETKTETKTETETKIKARGKHHALLHRLLPRQNPLECQYRKHQGPSRLNKLLDVFPIRKQWYYKPVQITIIITIV